MYPKIYCQLIILSIISLLLPVILLIVFTGSDFLPKMNAFSTLFHLAHIKETFKFECSIRGNKWIVVTSIFYPTPTIHKLTNLTSHWNIVIVGDRKTPNDWLTRYPINQSRIIFLSISHQQSLNFQILKYLPEDSYSRKNIGYLVAIACGAEVIFETDDDNLLDDNDIYVLPKIAQPTDVPWIAFRRNRSPFVNIYGSFGQPSIWPRGFPVDELKNVTEDGWHSVRRNKDEVIHAYIQQYLADHDPDVDALYRLTHPFTIGQIKFDRDQKPIALDSFTFSPYNTQNTVTHYDAFWGLYLPVTTTLRVCDIWRGLWVQRMLWDIGGRLVFGTATVTQVRNSHSYIADMDNEYQLYHQSGSFARFLSSWSSSASTLQQRIFQLIRDITQAGFWNAHEIDIMNAWMSDLNSIGYSFPAIHSHDSKINPIQRKRAAICVTGITRCIFDTWSKTSSKIRERLLGDIDIFMFLSSSAKLANHSSSYLNDLKEARSYTNTTVTILYEDRSLHDRIPINCTLKTELSTEYRSRFLTYLQHVWSLEQCYDLVHEYTKHFQVNYQLLIHSRVDLTLHMPQTFERQQALDINRNILVLPYRNFTGIDDRFALGPIELMYYYMTRWQRFHECPVNQSFQPEIYLESYLQQFTNYTIDSSMSAASDKIQYSYDLCH